MGGHILYKNLELDPFSYALQNSVPEIMKNEIIVAGGEEEGYIQDASKN